MSIYTQLQTKIEASGGAAGPKGSFNHKGGAPTVITYEVSPGVNEDHHVVPYLIGFANDAGGTNVPVLLAFKYLGQPAHPGTGFRCYKVARISALPAITA